MGNSTFSEMYWTQGPLSLRTPRTLPQAPHFVRMGVGLEEAKHDITSVGKTL